MKRAILPIVFFIVIVASCSFINAVGSDPFSDSIYDISSDVMPLAFPEGSGTQWWDYRIPSGSTSWQVHYPGNNSNTWSSPNGTLYLSDMLNNMGVASVADVQSTTALDSYFGEHSTSPFITSVYKAGTADTTVVNQKNIILILTSILFNLTRNSVALNGTEYLGADGNVWTSAVNMTAAEVSANGFVGLLTDLKPRINNIGTGLNTWNSISYQGLSVNGGLTNYSSPYLEGLNNGLLGLGVLQNTNNSTLSSFASANADALKNLTNKVFYPDTNTLTTKVYEVGLGGNGMDQEWSTLGQLEANYNSFINRSLISWHQSLQWDGTTDVNEAQTNLGLADITADGFTGLASILRGVNDGGAIEFTYTKRSWEDNSESEETFNNLFQAILFPLDDIQDALSAFLFSHGTNLDIEIRDNMGEQADAFVEDFTSPGGAGTPSADQISDTARLSSSLKDSFSSDATVADAMGQISDSGNYSFFSSQVQQELNPFYSSTRSISSEDDIVDYVTPKLNDILGGLGKSW